LGRPAIREQVVGELSRPVSRGTGAVERAPATTAWRLPKLLEAEPEAKQLLRSLETRSAPLWAGCETQVPQAELGPAVQIALKSAYSAGRIVRGLEGATRVLRTELQGLTQVDKKTGVARGGRVSRLVVLAGDGSERFYRDVESLLVRNSPRVLALRLPSDQETLGRLLFGPGQVARLLLVEHKDAVSAVLLALAKQWHH
jgi:hypothetical protein